MPSDPRAVSVYPRPLLAGMALSQGELSVPPFVTRKKLGTRSSDVCPGEGAAAQAPPASPHSARGHTLHLLKNQPVGALAACRGRSCLHTSGYAAGTVRGALYVLTPTSMEILKRILGKDRGFSAAGPGPHNVSGTALRLFTSAVNNSVDIDNWATKSAPNASKLEIEMKKPRFSSGKFFRSSKALKNSFKCMSVALLRFTAGPRARAGPFGPAVGTPCRLRRELWPWGL